MTGRSVISARETIKWRGIALAGAIVLSPSLTMAGEICHSAFEPPPHMPLKEACRRCSADLLGANLTGQEKQCWKLCIKARELRFFNTMLAPQREDEKTPADLFRRRANMAGYDSQGHPTRDAGDFWSWKCRSGHHIRW
jgi:hypothetical protein